MKSTIMIFLDGVGIGHPDPVVNPFFKYQFKLFDEIFSCPPSLENPSLESNNTYIFPVDASLGVEGLPLSGTGQTSIFCGVNAPEMIGKHFGPFPYSSLIPTIKEKNIFKDFLDRGYRAAFANAYPKVFFDYINSGKKRLSVTSLSCLLSGVRLKNATDLRRGQALSAEINNFRWVQKLGYNIPIVKPQTAAKRLLKLAGQNNFTLFEFFYSDHLGHGRIKGLMNYILGLLDEFLYYVIKNIEPETTLIICSDHGNVEDISVKGHTLNPAFTLTAGRNAEKLSTEIKNLADIKKAILGLYT